MALVKKSKIAASASQPLATPLPPTTKARKPPAARGRAAKPQTVFERVAAATEELASGLVEASAATKELGRSMEQIATGAEEAAGASQEQSAAIKRIAASLIAARAEAEKSGRRSEALTATLADATARIVRVGPLDRAQRRAPDGGRRAHHGARSARAGHRRDHANRQPHLGSDEPPGAECGNRGGARRRARPRLCGGRRRGARSRGDVRQERARSPRARRLHEATTCNESSTALRNAAEMPRKETKAAASVVESLQARRDDVAKIAEGSREILIAAAEAERAATEAAAGAEQIASAAEEQSSGAGQAQVAVQQQAKSLEQAQMAAQTLAALAERLRRGNSGAGSAEQIELGRGGAVGHDSGAVEHGQRDHGGGRADRSRLPDSRRPPRRRRRRRSTRSKRAPRLAEANIRAADERVQSDRGRAYDRAQLRREPHRRRARRPRGHAGERCRR